MKYIVIRHLEDKTLNWKRYSLRQLAEIVKVNYAYLSKVRAGKITCSEKVYLKLKEALKD